MKKITITLSIILLAFSLQVAAQAKKAKAQAKKTIASKPAAVVKTTVPAAEVKKASVAIPAKQSIVANAKDDYYKTALGVKLLYGIALTGKRFFNKTAALEAIIQYRNYSGLGSEFNLTALYEHHGAISGADGLRWYAGGGAYGGYYSSSYQGDGSSTLSLGATGVIGLEYKLKNIPLAFSADWQPIYIVNGNNGLIAESGGIGVKYTF